MRKIVRKEPRYRYRVRGPLPADSGLCMEGPPVSRHRSFNAALRSWKKFQRKARLEGKSVQYYLWDEIEQTRILV
jgi:hypothetical protein